MTTPEERKNLDEIYNELTEEKNTAAVESEIHDTKFDNVEAHCAEENHSSEHHSGEHHHSGRHHHRHETRKKKTNDGFKKFLKKRKKGINAICVIIAAIAVVVLFALLAEHVILTKNQEENSGNSAGSFINEIGAEEKFFVSITTPDCSEEFYLVNEAALAYLNSDSSVSVFDALNGYRGEDIRNDIGLPVEMRFGVEELTEGYSVLSAELEISEDESFENPLKYELDKKYSASIYNLKTGMKYYYRATFEFSEGEKVSVGGIFITAETPRILTIDGTRNTRDIGGWKTTDGKEIRQGVLYRGTEIDGAVKPEYKLTKKGIDEMLNILGVKTDMDLRWPEDHVNGEYILGQDVEHNYYSAAQYATVFEEKENERMRKIFSDFADEDKYPVYLHCTYGADRTGTICFILEAVLGLGEEDLIREYELTGLYSTAAVRENLAETISILDSYEGETTKEKAESYLLSIGVTEDEIKSIRNIFLE